MATPASCKMLWLWIPDGIYPTETIRRSFYGVELLGILTWHVSSTSSSYVKYAMYMHRILGNRRSDSIFEPVRCQKEAIHS